MIESLTKVINFVFAFVPGTIGVYEVEPEVILQKDSASRRRQDSALALVRKAAIVCWTSVGLLVLTSRTLPNAWRRLLDPEPTVTKDLWTALVFSNIAGIDLPGR